MIFTVGQLFLAFFSIFEVRSFCQLAKLNSAKFVYFDPVFLLSKICSLK